jgi:hypothetical protein
MKKYDSAASERCGGRMKVVAFLTEHTVVDRNIRHLELTFAAAKLPLPQALYQVFFLKPVPLMFALGR